jgi:hypothetical protein
MARSSQDAWSGMGWELLAALRVVSLAFRMSARSAEGGLRPGAFAFSASARRISGLTLLYAAMR